LETYEFQKISVGCGPTSRASPHRSLTRKARTIRSSLGYSATSNYRQVTIAITSIPNYNSTYSNYLLSPFTESES